MLVNMPEGAAWSAGAFLDKVTANPDIWISRRSDLGRH